MTRNDVLDGNADLIKAVMSELSDLEPHRISVEKTRAGFLLESPGSDFVQVTASGRPVGTFNLDSSGTARPRISGSVGRELEFVAFAGSRPVARTRHSL
jgi:hypothetical protein